MFDFKLDIGNAGALLDRVGLPRTLADGHGSVTGKVGWRGGPTALDFPLGGQIAIDLEHGQILKVDPGAAKLLGVLSLQSLARFLTLNFRDVIGKGLPFDKITGTGQISNGIARTDDFSMMTGYRTSPCAARSISAPEHRTCAHVAPKISAGARGAAIINPLLGVGVLAANYALSETLSRAFALDTRSPARGRTRIERVQRSG